MSLRIVERVERIKEDSTQDDKKAQDLKAKATDAQVKAAEAAAKAAKEKAEELKKGIKNESNENKSDKNYWYKYAKDQADANYLNPDDYENLIDEIWYDNYYDEDPSKIHEDFIKKVIEDEIDRNLRDREKGI